MGLAVRVKGARNWNRKETFIIRLVTGQGFESVILIPQSGLSQRNRMDS